MPARVLIVLVDVFDRYRWWSGSRPAQNRAITIESAPRSSKKLLSTGTRSTCITAASTSAKTPSIGVGAATSDWNRRVACECRCQAS